MRIVYNAPSNPQSDDTEGHIRRSLSELGHEVVPDGDGDLYLFHKQFNPPKEFTGKKVCWYFDKVWKDRPQWMANILPQIDHMFMTDETWARQSGYSHISILRQGIGGIDTSLGSYTPRYGCDVAFVGATYGERGVFVEQLKNHYGANFKVFNNVFNRDLFDLCASAKVIVAPTYPSDDYYWSNRIYLLAGSGAFVAHPRLLGLTEYTDQEIGFYDIDPIPVIDYYLSNEQERREVQMRGYERTIREYTYTQRCKKMLSELKRIGIIA